MGFMDIAMRLTQGIDANDTCGMRHANMTRLLAHMARPGATWRRHGQIGTAQMPHHGTSVTLDRALHTTLAQGLAAFATWHTCHYVLHCNNLQRLGNGLGRLSMT